MTVMDEVYQGDKALQAPGHPRILSLANQKGGVGKTTTAINLGTALAAIGERVLIVDLDPQGNASTGLGIDRRNRSCSTYDVLIGEAPLRDAVVATAVPRLHIAASTMDLSGLELELGTTPAGARVSVGESLEDVLAGRIPLLKAYRKGLADGVTGAPDRLAAGRGAR